VRSSETMAGPVTGTSLPDLIREAIGETRDWVKAEIALLHARVSAALAKYAIAAFACMLAAMLTLIAFIYLAYAVMLLLRPYLGEAGAALAAGGTLLVAAVVAWLFGRAKFLGARTVPARMAQVQNGPRKKKS
jgi:Putative Actinobacterial Holin-X, holin superfamily III